MKKSVKNVFNEGMLLDVHASAQKNTTTRKTVNFRVITRDNNSFIVTNVKGNELKGQITANYVPLAINDKNGVAYIISAEVINGVATGRGEIGCFPSPNYSAASGSLVNAYSPLMNYAGDAATYPDMNGPFRSELFNFTLENIPDIELQNDYDGSVNVIFASSNNPMRIINSGFVVKPGKKYDIIDRDGLKDTNRYTRSNFENVINLVSGSTKIMKVTFEESVAGGILPHANNQYYFAYGTSDGNETEIVGQSFSVPVFNGERMGNITGGRLTGESTNKMNRFTLSNLDESFAYVAVYVVATEGMNTAVKTAYRIAQRFNILGSSMEFVHTGYEDKITVPVSDLEDKSVSIDSAETLAQSNGFLMLGNVKEKEYDVDSVRKFFRMVKLGHKQVSLDMFGPEASFTRVFDEPLNQTAIKAGTDGYNGGYLNPKNIHDKLGYWGGEAYPFAGRLIFPDGSVSHLFPVVGYDATNALAQNAVDDATLATIDGLDSAGGFSSADTMLNSKGIFRFPNRGVNGLFSKDATSGEGRMTVNGITFSFKDPTTGLSILDKDLGGGVTIKDISIGIQFFRGERKADAIMQGMMMDAIMVPLTRHDENDGEDGGDQPDKLWNYNGGKYTEANCKFVPAFDHILESLHKYHNDGHTPALRDTVMYHGLVPFRFNLLNRDPHTVLQGYHTPLAFISSDLVVNPAAYSGIASKNIKARLLYTLNHEARIKTTRYAQNEGSGDHFSVLVPEINAAVNIAARDHNARASWTPENTEAKNSLGFSSATQFQCRGAGFTDPYFLFRNKYNAYLGVRLDAKIRAGTPTGNTGEAGEEANNLLNSKIQASWLANIYEDGGPRPPLAVKQIYQNIDGIRYFPISGRMYWSAGIDGADATNVLDGQLDADKKITLFNGDCFINFSFRKLFSNSDFDLPETNPDEATRVGYTVALVNEANHNAAFRSLETVDLVEGERKHPLAYTSKNSSTGDSYGRNNLWREYWLTESAGYNKGYSQISGAIPSLTLPQDIPYSRSHWRTRVWHSGQHIQNSFENGYRRFFRTSYRDYPTQYGEIVKLISNNSELYCIQENSVGVIPINERIQTGSDTGGPIFIEAPTVLGPKMKMLSEEIGSRHKQSIASSDNFVYGVAADNSIIWHTTNDKLIFITDMAIRSYLEDNYGSNSLAIYALNHNIISTVNAKFGEILFTFYNKETGNFANDRSFTVQFNETSRKIHSFYSFVPVQYFSVRDDLYSFNVKSASNQFWLHDSDNVDMTTFYGVQEDASLAFAVNEDAGIQKGYSNLSIDSNRVMPKTIRYKVSGALSEHNLVSITGNRMQSNASYKKGFWNIAVPKIVTVHNQDIERAVPDTKAGASNALAVRSRVKDKYAIIELVYNTGDLIELNNVITHYKLIR